MRRIKFILVFAAVLFTVPTAWAINETVKNKTDQPIKFNAGRPIEILPGQTAEISKEEMEYPPVYRMIHTGRLEVMPRDLTFEDCEVDDHDGYCYMDVAVQNKNTVGCSYYDLWSSAKECLYYVDRERKLTEKDCWSFDPGSSLRQSCQDYIAKGIPSASGRRYEESLKFE